MATTNKEAKEEMDPAVRSSFARYLERAARDARTQLHLLPGNDKVIYRESLEEGMLEITLVLHPRGGDKPVPEVDEISAATAGVEHKPAKTAGSGASAKAASAAAKTAEAEGEASGDPHLATGNTKKDPAADQGQGQDDATKAKVKADEKA
jgi:hypothetical protein